MKRNFNEKCYEILKKVPKGKVITYKQIANKLRCKGYRAVGRAMNKNKDIKNIHCYRVVKSDGSVGGFNKGRKEKIRMLKREGISIKNGRIDLKKYGYIFE